MEKIGWIVPTTVSPDEHRSVEISPIQDPKLVDVNGEYHRLVDNFKWEDTQEPRNNKVGGIVSVSLYL